MTEEEFYCGDCEHMVWHDPTTLEEMDCVNPAASPENGAPELIVSEPHNCPFFEKRKPVLVSKYLLEKIIDELNKINGLDAVKQYGYCGPGYAEVFDDDAFEMDFTDLIKKISELLE